MGTRHAGVSGLATGRPGTTPLREVLTAVRNVTLIRRKPETGPDGGAVYRTTGPSIDAASGGGRGSGLAFETAGEPGRPSFLCHEGCRWDDRPDLREARRSDDAVDVSHPSVVRVRV